MNFDSNRVDKATSMPNRSFSKRVQAVATSFAFLCVLLVTLLVVYVLIFPVGGLNQGFGNPNRLTIL